MLYEVITEWTFPWRREPSGSGERDDRITSYNVCYTKLLRTLRQAGLTKVEEGVTTLEEVLRVTAPD